MKAKLIQTGQRWKKSGDGDVYILAQVDTSKVALICLEDDANRWQQPVRVEDINNIQPKEWAKIKGWNEDIKWTLVK